MAFLVGSIPPIHVLVKKEYLYDLEKGHGEYTPGIWITVKSVLGKALYFETLLTEYGALYDKLPLSAFVWKEEVTNPLPLHILQLWDCFDYDFTVIEKQMLGSCEFYGKDRNMHKGEYMFTIDSCHGDVNMIDTGVSEVPSEHKQHNFGKLDNGQFFAQPNNRMLWYEQSLTPKELKQLEEMD